jgi:hypothetical protein
MADAKPDCERINVLITLINDANREVDQILKDMDALGFGTAKTVRFMKRAYTFADFLYQNVPPVVWKVLYKFINCNDQALAELAVNEMKILVQVLQAHAELLLETIDDDALRGDLQKWLDKLSDELKGWADNRTTEDAIAAVKVLKAFVKTIVRNATPWILEALVDAFGPDVVEAAENWLTKEVVKQTIKQIIYRILVYEIKKKLGKEALKLLAKTSGRIAGVAMTGWELLVQIAGTDAADDLRTYVDRLLAELVILLEKCGKGWPQGKNGLRLVGDKYLDAKITGKPFVRCARNVDGKLQWSAPCALRFDNGRPAGLPSFSGTLTAAKRDEGGGWIIRAPIVEPSVTNAPCVKDAKFCYTFIELTMEYPDGKRHMLALIVGAKTF